MTYLTCLRQQLFTLAMIVAAWSTAYYLATAFGIRTNQVNLSIEYALGFAIAFIVGRSIVQFVAQNKKV